MLCRFSEIERFLFNNVDNFFSSYLIDLPYVLQKFAALYWQTNAVKMSYEPNVPRKDCTTSLDVLFPKLSFLFFTHRKTMFVRSARVTYEITF